MRQKETPDADNLSVEMPEPPDHLRGALDALMAWQNNKMSMEEMTAIMKKLSEDERDQVLEYLGEYNRVRRLAHEQEATRSTMANVLRIPARVVRVSKGPVTEFTSETISTVTMMLRSSLRALREGWRRGGETMPS